MPNLSKAFFFWLKNCFYSGGQHGFELVNEYTKMAYGKYATFPADADDELRKVEETLGWIKRGKFEPTISQRAFLGLTYAGKVPEDYKKYHESAWYWYVPKEKNLEVIEWLKIKGKEYFGETFCSEIGCMVSPTEGEETCSRH